MDEGEGKDGRLGREEEGELLLGKGHMEKENRNIKVEKKKQVEQKVD